MASSPHGGRFEAYRPVVMARGGMVCSAHPLASEAGIAILRAGGNAVDAAIAVAAAVAVAEPHLSGIGGDGYIMIYDAGARTIRVVNATGAAPLAATLAGFADGIPLRGPRSATVPALVDGWLEAHARYGTQPIGACFASAIALAADGVPVTAKLARALADEPALLEFPASRAIFAPHGEPLQPGELLVQRDLARTLEAIARGGRAGFYDGPVAQALVDASDRAGGRLSRDDLQRCRARWDEPITTTYRGYAVFEAPPNSSGHVLLQELNLIEHFDLAAWGWGSADAIHTLVEAKRLAFADRERFVADPDFCEVPLTELLSKAYAAQRVTEIRSDRAAPRVGAGEPRRFAEAAGQTTCFAVVDRAGNAVCQLQSLQSFWGSGFVADGTGILLNNRMTYFRLDPSHPNVLAPGKRVRHTMNPVMAMRDGELELVFGTPGADSQVQTNLQIMTGIVDFGMNVAEAVEAPRWRHLGRDTESTTPYGLCDALIMESRFAPELLAALAARGQPVERIGPWDAAGSAVAIRIDRAQRVLHGACDPRADGYALGC